MRVFRRHDGRYYAILEPLVDLLGDKVLVTYHGSIHSRLGGVKSWPVDTIDVADIARMRLRHGYLEEPGLPGTTE